MLHKINNSYLQSSKSGFYRNETNSTKSFNNSQIPENKIKNIEDKVEISEKALSLNENNSKKSGETTRELNSEDQKELLELKKVDREVRSHEQAHKAAAGGLSVSGPNYVYKNGPDGKRYAVGGEVKIQVRDGRTPEETIKIARQLRSAALAPSNPSSQDKAVAASAAQMSMQAQAEILAKTNESENTIEEIKKGDLEADSQKVEKSSIQPPIESQIDIMV